MPGAASLSRKPSTTFVACSLPLEILFGRNVTAHGICTTRFWNLGRSLRLLSHVHVEEETMDGIIYLVGLIVIVMFILSLFGLR
jgi:hypothetical protein